MRTHPESSLSFISGYVIYDLWLSAARSSAVPCDVTVIYFWQWLEQKHMMICFYLKWRRNKKINNLFLTYINTKTI